MRKAINDTYQLECSGRTFYAHKGVIGIVEEGGSMELGFDGSMSIDSNELIPEEKKELALYMIKQWADFGGVTYTEFSLEEDPNPFAIRVHC